jgi:hypothetical protein
MASVKTAALVLISATHFAGAAVADPAKTVRPGIESEVGSAYDCDMKYRAPVVWARADHGTAAIREIDGPFRQKSMKVAGSFYKSGPGFVGEDTVIIIGILAGGKHRYDRPRPSK